MKWLKGLQTYSFGNSCFGMSWTFRNVGDYKSDLIRRYIRIQIRIFGGTFLMEYRFANSI
jgi:hypothetical protein